MEWNNDRVRQQFENVHLFEKLFAEYSIYSLGSNIEKDRWKRKIFGKWRQRLVKLFIGKKVGLNHFNTNKDYGNVLLIPHKYSTVLTKLNIYL